MLRLVLLPYVPYRAIFCCAVALGALAVACSDSAGVKPLGTAQDGGAGPPEDAFNAGEELRVPVPAPDAPSPRVYVKLASPPAIVVPLAPATDKSWDLAFEGLDVYTSSGPSGAGSAQAFGPLDAIAFLGDTSPQVPFLSADKAGGAFIRWYFYEGAPNHALFSRFHVFGVKDGERRYRVQVLSYYGKRDGAPISALYKIRYAEVGQPAREAADLDGTAGGASGGAEIPSECIDLGTGERMMLTAVAARASSSWHLCFRREDITVNGELGGPRDVGAIDFDADKTSTEKLEDIVERTPESELARFDSINASSFADQTLRGDRIVSAFSGLWTERGVSPPTPTKFAWLVVGADGRSRYLVGFSRFEGATASSPGTVVLRVKPVK